jgi:hypothetical protein
MRWLESGVEDNSPKKTVEEIKASIENTNHEVVDPIKEVIAEINTLATTLAKTNREDVVNAIGKHHKNNKGEPTANYNNIKDLDIAKSVLEELKKIGGNK